MSPIDRPPLHWWLLSIKLAVGVAIGIILFFASTASTHAQATRTWVSGVGDDANPCSRTAPCKTFAGAISKTAPGGEIDALDPGGYGAVTITKSITIDGTGTFASILASGTNGIIVNAAATDEVIIRGLSIQGAGTGINGIRVLAGRAVYVEDTVIEGFTNAGIDFQSSTNGAALFVTNVNIRDNGTNPTGGNPDTRAAIFADSTTAATVSVDRSRFEDARIGFSARNRVRAIIRDSVITNNAGSGVASQPAVSLTTTEMYLLNKSGRASAQARAGPGAPPPQGVW